jgi:formamidopyrimidine-DNA glycosylase
MPELPEVEVTRLSFSGRIEGARVTAVRIGKPLRWPLGVAPGRLVGQTVGRVERRGKYLWLPLERGGLLMHLGIRPSRLAERVPAHGRTTTSTSSPAAPCSRRSRPSAGCVAATRRAAGRQAARQAGLEPGSALRRRPLHAALRTCRVSGKQALLGGAIVVGAGTSTPAKRSPRPASIRAPSDRIVNARRPPGGGGAGHPGARSNSADRLCATAMPTAPPASSARGPRLAGRAGECVRCDGTVRHRQGPGDLLPPGRQRR